MGGGAPIQSLERAITQIGASEVMRAALAGGLGKVAIAPGPLIALRHRVWLEALLAAGLAQELAALRGLQGDIAFLAGLLHDFGKVVLLATLDQGGGEGPKWPAERWFEIIDKHHVDAGVRAAREWKLPQAVVEIIRAHHGNVAIDSGYKPLLQIVQLTDRIVELMGRSSVIATEDLRQGPGHGARRVRPSRPRPRRDRRRRRFVLRARARAAPACRPDGVVGRAAGEERAARRPRRLLGERRPPRRANPLHRQGDRLAAPRRARLRAAGREHARQDDDSTPATTSRS